MSGSFNAEQSQGTYNDLLQGIKKFDPNYQAPMISKDNLDTMTKYYNDLSLKEQQRLDAADGDRANYISNTLAQPGRNATLLTDHSAMLIPQPNKGSLL